MVSIPAGHGAEAGSKTLQKQAVEPYVALGHLSIAPATHTTVVTTTTTTTTSYPPIVIEPPRNLKERDSKEYPLANSTAPESIRRFLFPAGDSQACFEEANDVLEKVEEVIITVPRTQTIPAPSLHTHSPGTSTSTTH
jgi:F-box and WD-40 domain protein CDC4